MQLEDRKKIQELLEEGFGYSTIARLMGRAKNTIWSEINRCPKNQYNAIEAQNDYESKVARLRGCGDEFLRDDQLEKIKNMTSLNLSIETMRTRLHCSRHKIEQWISKNAPGYRGGRVEGLEQRLSNIEQQIEILFDLLKEKKN